MGGTYSQLQVLLIGTRCLQEAFTEAHAVTVACDNGCVNSVNACATGVVYDVTTGVI